MSVALIYRKGHKQYRTLMEKSTEQLFDEGFRYLVQFSEERLDVATDTIESAQLIAPLYDGFIGIFELVNDQTSDLGVVLVNREVAYTCG